MVVVVVTVGAMVANMPAHTVTTTIMDMVVVLFTARVEVMVAVRIAVIVAAKVVA